MSTHDVRQSASAMHEAEHRGRRSREDSRASDYESSRSAAVVDSTKGSSSTGLFVQLQQPEGLVTLSSPTCVHSTYRGAPRRQDQASSGCEAEDPIVVIARDFTFVFACFKQLQDWGRKEVGEPFREAGGLRCRRQGMHISTATSESNDRLHKGLEFSCNH